MVTKSTTVRKKLDELSTSGIPIFGYSVFWSLRDFNVSRDALVELVLSTFGSAFVPRRHPAKKAMRRGLEQAASEGFVRKVRDDSVLAAFAAVTEEVDPKALDLQLVREAVVVLDKSTGDVDVRHANKELADTILDKIDSYRTVFDSGDVRGVILRFLQSRAAVTLRQTGGIYFVPEKSTVDTLSEFFKGLNKFNGDHCQLVALPLADSQLARSQMSDIIRTELRRDLQLAGEEVKLYFHSDRLPVRQATYENRLEDYKILREKCEMYAEVLESDAKRMIKEIMDLESEVRDALEDKLAESPLFEKYPWKSRVIYSGSAVKRHGEHGTVVGYSGDTYLKILFDKTGEVVGISNRLLEPEVDPAVAALSAKGIVAFDASAFKSGKRSRAGRGECSDCGSAAKFMSKTKAYCQPCAVAAAS